MRQWKLMRTFLGVLIALAVTLAQSEAAAAGTVVYERWHSAALGVSKGLFVYLPASYSSAPGRRYPTVYLLTGWGGNEADWVTLGNIDEVADAVFGAGAQEMILVMPDGDSGWYVNWEQPLNWDQCQADLRHAAVEFCVRNAGYADYIAHDLLEHVDRTYRTKADRAHRGVGGYSMGGFGSLYLGLTHPNLYAAVVSIAGTGSLLFDGPRPFEPPLRYMTELTPYTSQYKGWETNEGLAFGLDVATWRKRDLAQLAQQLAGSGAKPPVFYLTIGTDDKRSIDSNRALAWDLGRLNLQHEFHEVPGGVHAWSFVQGREADVLRWFATKLGRPSPDKDDK